MAFMETDEVTGKNRKIRITSRMYENLRQKHRKLVSVNTTGRIWINNGKENRRVYPDEVPDGWEIGSLMHHNKGRITINDGKHHKRILPGEKIPEGWTKGSIKSKEKYIQISNGKEFLTINAKDKIPEGFYRKSKVVITNGIRNSEAYPWEIPDGWKIGKVKARKAKRYLITDGKTYLYLFEGESIPKGFYLKRKPEEIVTVTNGIKEIKVLKSQIPSGYRLKPKPKKIYVTNGVRDRMVEPNKIPKGFWPGRSKKTTKGKVWINNGVVARMVYPTKIPSGFKLGMLPK